MEGCKLIYHLSRIPRVTDVCAQSALKVEFQTKHFNLTLDGVENLRQALIAVCVPTVNFCSSDGR